MYITCEDTSQHMSTAWAQQWRSTWLVESPGCHPLETSNFAASTFPKIISYKCFSFSLTRTQKPEPSQKPNPRQPLSGRGKHTG